MQFTVAQVAGLIGGHVEGKADNLISGLGKIQDALPNEISFLSNLKYEPFLYSTQAGAVIVGEDLQLKSEVTTSLIRVKDPYTAFTLLLEQYQKLLAFAKQGKEEPAFVHQTASLGEGFYIGAFAYLGQNVKLGKNCKIYPQVHLGDNVQIGDNTIIYPGVKIYKNTKIGSHCTIQAGAVIGSDGFGFAPQADGSYKTIPQLGNVIIEDHCDVGANTVIDCATLGSTIIRKGVKLDNLIQIAHNVEIGSNTVIAAQTGVSGSAFVGEGCMIGGQVGIVGHIKLAKNTKVAGQSGVGNNVEEEGMALQGSPAAEIHAERRSIILYRKLPEMMKRIAQLEEKMLQLVNKENLSNS